MLHREHPGLFLAAAFAAGLWARGAGGPAVATTALLAGAVTAAAVVGLLCGAAPPWTRPALRAALLAVVGLWRGGEGRAPGDPADAPPLPITVEGTVIEPPVEVVRDERGIRAVRTLFSIETADGSALRATCPGSLRGILGGRRVVVSGTILPARGPRNPGDGPARGPPLLDVPHPGNVQAAGGGIDRSLAGLAGALRGAIHRVLDALYSERSRGFVLAMLLGDRRLLAPDIKEALLLTGTFHLLAISGLHIVLVMALVLRLPLPARGRTAMRLGILGAFTALTGASPPVLRAALMFTIGALLERAGRRTRPLNTLGWTALLLLGAAPDLLQDVGFQLSFVAVLSILTLSARLAPPEDGRAGARGRGRWLTAWVRPLAGSLAVSVGASAGTAPITLVHFQRIHPLGPLWNLLAYPLTVIPLAGGFASVALGLIHPILGLPVAWLVERACEWLLYPLAIGATLPGSTVFVPPPPAIIVVLACGALAAPLLGGAKAWSLWGAGAVLAGASAMAVLWPREAALWTFDAGPGDAALLSVPGAGAFLIDAGSRGPDADAGANLTRAVLTAGERSLRAIFLTHPHTDHLRGLDGLLDRVRAAEVWVEPCFEEKPAGAREAEAIRRRGIALRGAPRGISLRFPGAPGFRIDVLHPVEAERLPLRKSANDSSLALRITMEQSRILFLGDLEEAGIARLLSAAEDLRADILIAPHHGRDNALWPEILEQVRPRTVIMSGDGGGGAVATAARIEASGIPVHATWRGGAVRTRWNRSKGWEPSYWRKNP